MFAARDQENVVHGLQQAAASKPLNQNTRTLQPKTPGARFPKTPLRVPLNDENNPGGFGGKTNLGTKGKGLGGKLDTNSFVTPLGSSYALSLAYRGLTMNRTADRQSSSRGKDYERKGQELPDSRRRTSSGQPRQEPTCESQCKYPTTKAKGSREGQSRRTPRRQPPSRRARRRIPATEAKRATVRIRCLPEGLSQL